jgi:hypothetical protein
MPRLKPPPGHVTATEAAKRLGVSDAMLYRYVKEGKLHRVGPEKRVHRFYSIAEIDALLATERYFYTPGQWRYNPSSTFEIASEADMQAIYEISCTLFKEPPSVETRLTWLRKEPETFHVLRNRGNVVGFASLLPMNPGTLQDFIHDKIDSADITFDDIERFEPGKPLHLYVMAIAIDQRKPAKERGEYGARLMAGLFHFLLDLAQRGIEIEDITARTQYRDGLRLLRKLGIPQIHSPIPGKKLFYLRVPDSGADIFEEYTELLNRWKATHTTQRATIAVAPPTQPVVHTPPTPKARTPREASAGGGTIPDGYVPLSDFYHGIAQSTAKRNTKDIVTVGDYRDASGHVVNKLLSPQQQRQYWELMHWRPGFESCDRCPHEQ